METGGQLCNVYVFVLIIDEFEGSMKHLLQFYDLTRLNKWHTDSGERLHPIACEHLRRVYTKMAGKVCLTEYLIVRIMII